MRLHSLALSRPLNTKALSLSNATATLQVSRGASPDSESPGAGPVGAGARGLPATVQGLREPEGLLPPDNQPHFEAAPQAPALRASH